MSDSLKDVFDAADEKGWDRRAFLRYVGMGWGSLIALAGVSVVGLWKFLLPNVLELLLVVILVGSFHKLLRHTILINSLRTYTHQRNNPTVLLKEPSVFISSNGSNSVAFHFTNNCTFIFIR